LATNGEAIYGTPDVPIRIRLTLHIRERTVTGSEVRIRSLSSELTTVDCFG